MGHREHRREGPRAVPCAVVTVSDTRKESTDRSGASIRAALARAGHPIVDYRIMRDERASIVRHLKRLARAGKARIVLITGGTGIASRDATTEAVGRMIEKELPGFGEIFRALSYRRIGSSAMLSRAVAGIYRGLALFSMPGSEAAVRLAMRRLILPEITHVAGLLAKGRRR